MPLGTGPLPSELGLCGGHGSSKLRYLVCGQQLGVCRGASDEVVPETLLLQGELCVSAV